MRLARTFSILLALLMLALASACGKKGPLYLPPSDVELKAAQKQVEPEKEKTDKTSSKQNQ